MGVIFLDNNATTRPDVQVVDAMARCAREVYGNASSLHVVGQSARHAIEEARAHVANLIGARPREIVFTSGGTESDNLAILGTLAAYPARRHVVTTAVEHLAVHSLCQRLAGEGVEVTFVGVDSLGRLNMGELERAIRHDTALVSVMHANNETGVIFPVGQVAALGRARGVPVHVDAVQTAGRMPVDVREMGASLVSISAHKMHGPKGAGALYVSPGTRLRGQLAGGHQERDLRPGTENVAAIVGFGVAAGLAGLELAAGMERVRSQRDRLEKGLLERLPFSRVNGDCAMRVPGTCNIAFTGLEAEAILIAMSQEGVCASAGSACSSGALEPSHVLAAMGLPDAVARGSIRLSLARNTTDEEIDSALSIIPRVVSKLKALAN
jgi:cysteine desulfurase